ncbi:MAG TPA: DNA-formamidopyrimidine glycosylase family protein [Longimicrobiales bacterium]|nr:DNA-formamidopyrimidine glycosylase family protein [Longimicrobiales bacterium]
MPELPEVLLYIHALEPRVIGRELQKVRVRSPSLLRTYDPPLSATFGKTVRAMRRIGKRIVLELDDDLFVSIHLMIAGRFRWKDEAGAAIPGKVGLAGLDFDRGTLLLVEAATKKRAALHVVRGESALAELDRGGVDPLTIDYDEFVAALTRENHTVKRALTDPRLLSGIGNAHSDEILWRARLSPFRRTRQLVDDELRTLFAETRASLTEWIARLQAEAGDRFPAKVTAFHPAMAVHGKFREPCPRCGTQIQRIVHGAHETNYCPTCQTGGRLLKDRALSRLLGEDWPRSVEDFEEGFSRSP